MLNFQIALTSVEWDNSYINTLRFDSRAQQEQYFNVASIFNNAPNVNLPIGTLLTTSIVVEQPESLKLNPIMNYNYAIIRDNRVGADLKYYYYFVTQITQQSGNQIRLNIELDVIQTYYIECTFEDCVINRAHLNRFKKNTKTGLYRFNLDYKSNLFNKETEPLPLRCKWRDRLIWYYDNQSVSPFNDYFQKFQNDGQFWVYVYIDVSFNPNNVFRRFENGDAQIMPYVVLCAPSRGIPVKIGDQVIQWTIEELTKAMDTSTMASHILSYKISPIAPFNYSNQWQYYDTTNYFKLVADGAGQIGEIEFVKANMSTAGYVWLANLFTQPYDSGNSGMVSFVEEFSATRIKNSLKDSKFNPKLLSQDFCEYKIEDYAGNSFAYDKSKMYSDNLTVKVQEYFSPDLSKIKLNLNIPATDYTLAAGSPEHVNDEYFGLIVSNDTQYPYTVSQLSNFLANNKNFALQQQAQRDYNTRMGNISAIENISKGVAGSLSAAGSGNILGVVGGIGGGAAGAAAATSRAKAQNELNTKQQAFTLDNARNAPASVQNAQGNIFFNSMVNFLGFYVSEWECLEADKEKIADYMFRFGFSYERIDNPKNVDNIRHYFNYVQADIENVSHPSNISNSVHDKLRDIFRNGVRFWNVFDNTVKFEYKNENYERYLENE